MTSQTTPDKTSPEAISRSHETHGVVSPLRARMIEDMTIRGFVAKTQVDYIRCVKRFAAFVGRSPDTATPEEIRQFQFALSGDGERWIARRKGFFLPVRVLAKLFQRLMLEKLLAAHAAGKLVFYGGLAHLADARALKHFLRPARRRKWYVYAKRPFAGPKAVLAYLSRYTHRVAISNRRLIRADANTVTFKVKNYRLKGQRRHTTMTLATPEFIRRFLIHVLPKGLHRIRHYGLFANTVRAANLARMRELLGVPESRTDDRSAEDAPETPYESDHATPPCSRCGGTMRIIEIFDPGCTPRSIPTPEGIDSS